MGNGLIDLQNSSSDWLKNRWTWPEYKSKEFYKRLEAEGVTLREFQTWQTYISAVRDGLIIDDEWTGIRVDWGNQWMIDEFDLETQLVFRTEQLFENILQALAEAQAFANRALTKEETGIYLLNIIAQNTAEAVDSSRITVVPAEDVTGIDGLESVDQGDAWASVLLGYSAGLVNRIVENKLPQIWVKKGARAVYIEKRNLIIVPGVEGQFYPLLAHAAAHYIESLGKNLEAAEIARNSAAMPGTLHMIRPGLYALRGPWLDQQDGALRGYKAGVIEKWYDERKLFSEEEIFSTFTGKPTEFLSMTAQRIARADSIEIASIWTRMPMQLLTFMAVSRGNFMEKPDGV